MRIGVPDGEARGGSRPRPQAAFEREIEGFHQFGMPTTVAVMDLRSSGGEHVRVPAYVNEFWTSKQRAALRLHEISYRACFKPQLPRFFIERLTQPGDRVYDPFMGRGTTLLEASLLGRQPWGCDINPLSRILLAPRLRPPTGQEVAERMREIDLQAPGECAEGLLAFYHPETLSQICSLRQYLLDQEAAGDLDDIDRWIRMVAVTRLTGHSPGFFSVYTLPPNQAVSVRAQRKINAERRQVPEKKDVKDLILRKSRSLLSDCDPALRARLLKTARDTVLLSQPASSTPQLPSSSISLVVTSPPFLDVVDYAQDNWLRCWFCGIDAKAVSWTNARRLEEWQAEMSRVFVELARLLKPGGHVAFEVGEVRGGRVKLEETALGCGLEAGLSPRLVLIHRQAFTKTSQCWGVENGRKGTNTNRVVLFQKSDP